LVLEILINIIKRGGEMDIITSIKELQEHLVNFTTEQLIITYEEFLSRNYEPLDTQVRNEINEEMAKRYYKLIK